MTTYKNTKESYWADVKETLLLVAALPGQFYLVLVLEFLNAFRTGGLRFVLYTYVTNEFHFSDKRAGAILGIKGLLDVFFGLTGSILVDLIGVRNTSLYALAMAIVGRSILCFSTSPSALCVALFFFSPCGEALLGTGLYRVALKKLSTPRIRPFVFGLAYATNNSAGVIADIIITIMRSRSDSVIMGMVFTPTRKFIIATFISLLISFFLALFYLRDLTIANELDPEEGVIIPCNAKDADRPFSFFIKSNKLPQYKVFDTWYGTKQIYSNYVDIETTEDENASKSKSPNAFLIIQDTIVWILKQVKELLFYTDTWRLMIFGFIVVPIGMQWMAADMIMPPFLERNLGEDVPIYMVQSINYGGCLILPPIVSALTTHMDDLNVILPGLWIMAIAPLLIMLNPSIIGASLWQVILTIGEVFWSPRVQSWTARLAPTGKEGLFFALATTRAILAPATDYFLGYLNSMYNPNCPDCRDDYGHFCSIPLDMPNNSNGIITGQCGSQESVCNNLYFISNEGSAVCANTCMDCPGWKSDSYTLWSIILILSIFSPITVWILLPFFHGVKNINEGFYGIFDCGLHRIFNICGGIFPKNDKKSNKSSSYVKLDNGQEYPVSKPVHTIEEGIKLLTSNGPTSYGSDG